MRDPQTDLDRLLRPLRDLRPAEIRAVINALYSFQSKPYGRVAQMLVTALALLEKEDSRPDPTR